MLKVLVKRTRCFRLQPPATARAGLLIRRFRVRFPGDPRYKSWSERCTQPITIAPTTKTREITRNVEQRCAENEHSQPAD